MTSLPVDVVASPAATREVAATGVPQRALRAYRVAESALRIVDPACGLSWDILAGIGGLESDHGRRPAGRLGPMRIVPSVWRMVGVDGDADGRRNPRDIDDAALGAATYLCAGDEDLGTEQGRRAALLRYNRSSEYAAAAMTVATDYEHTVDDVPPLTAVAMGPDGPGVDVGLGTPGKGVLIGGSDAVSEPEAGVRRAGRRGHGPADQHDQDRAGPRRPGGDFHRGDGRTGAGHGRPGSRPEHTSPGESGGHAKDDGKDHGHGHDQPARPGGAGAKPPKPTHPPTPGHSPSHGPDRPKPPRPSPSKPPRPGNGSGRPDRPDRGKPPATAQFTGAVEGCGGSYCLSTGADSFRLKGTQSFDLYTGQQVVVTGVLRGGVLTVDTIIVAAG